MNNPFVCVDVVLIKEQSLCVVVVVVHTVVSPPWDTSVGGGISSDVRSRVHL